MVFIEKDFNDNEWYLLFRSFAGNRSSDQDQSLPMTSLQEWTKGDTNVMNSGNFLGAMKEEPDPSMWYKFCNRKKMMKAETKNMPTGPLPFDGNVLIDQNWKVGENGQIPDDPELNVNGNYWPNTNIAGARGGDGEVRKSVTNGGSVPDGSKYSYPSIQYPIIWRSVTNGSKAAPYNRKVPDWALNIYYKRITPWDGMNIKDLFLNNFGPKGFNILDKSIIIGNIPDIDFELYSTLEDALATDDENLWWDEMSEEEKEIFKKPKNPKRWKIYPQAMDTDDSIKTTGFGDQELGFPNLLGPTIGNTNINQQFGKPRNQDDDITRREDDGVAEEEASISYMENFLEAVSLPDRQGTPELLQACEWKFYVLAFEEGCVLDYDSKRSNGIPLAYTRYINEENVPDHLKCTDDKPVCDGYVAYPTGKFDLSTKYGAGIGQSWGQCRGLGKDEVANLNKASILESVSNRISDMQSLEVKPFTHVRDAKQLSNIDGTSEAASGQDEQNQVSILSVDTSLEESSDGKYFNFQLEKLDNVFGELVKDKDIKEVIHLRINDGNLEKVQQDPIKVIIFRSSYGGSSGDGHGRLLSNPVAGYWETGDVIRPRFPKKLNNSTQGLGGSLEDTRFANAAFQNLKARYEQRLDVLDDTSHVLQIQLKQLKKKEDKILKNKYNLTKEKQELNKNTRSVTIEHEYDRKNVLIYNMLTILTGISCLFILRAILIKGSI